VKRPVEVFVAILLPPLATFLAWFNVMRRNDLLPPHKGLWIVLCALPVLGPLLYLGIGNGALW